MAKLIIFILLLVIPFSAICAKNTPDSLSRKIERLQSELNILKNRTDEVRTGQLNYAIERDLLKETYSANYELLNTVITIILGIVGIFSFLGIRDIHSIKENFKQELDSMKMLKAEFEIKSKNFDLEKERFDSEIKNIINQNEEQNKKIKVLELKEKVKKLMEDRQNTSAYDYCTIALELSPEDLTLLTYKATLLCRLNNFMEATEIFEKIYLCEETNTRYAGNYVESLFFINKPDKAKEIIKMHPEYFNDQRKGVLTLFNILENYFILDEEKLKNYVTTLLDFKGLEVIKKHIPSWSITESLHFLYFQPSSNKKIICQNILAYFDGQIDAKTVCERLLIEIPSEVV